MKTNFDIRRYVNADYLTEREKAVLIERRIKLNTLEITARKYSVTRERIRQIESKAIDKINRKINIQKNPKDMLNYFPIRTVNALKHIGVYNLEQLKTKTIFELRNCRGLGGKGIKEILSLIKLDKRCMLIHDTKVMDKLRRILGEYKTCNKCTKLQGECDNPIMISLKKILMPPI